MDFEKHFHLSVFGQLESVFLPLGCDSKAVYCRYEILAGPDWELVSGARTGITQSCSASRQRFQEISFNMPLEFTYKSTNPFGWPQIVVSFWGSNLWGTEVCRGYARLHIPLPERGKHRKIQAPIVTPKPMDLCTQIMAWITDWAPELRDPSVLASGNRTKGIHTESYGHLQASFDVLTRGSEALHLEWSCH
ncbi:B9 domain-containing protein 1 [Phlebotomus argentipes]|uniref:B9 domain-containing protein 1 n=1 Tax=Phlebotomus argentipes TaxID=94469 RepID=UPI002892E3BF|nr:B9 domain-containing protein 1 [Phlebotomus argentipes]